MKMKDSARKFFSLLIGAVFCFSSAMKLMDPTGTGLIVDGYLKFFNLDVLRPSSKILGELLSLAEAVTGIGLITGLWRKTFAVTASVLTAFFTVVTVVLYHANPDMDCGCFGQAIHLTHGETLLKNIVLCLLCAGAFIPFSSLSGKSSGRHFAFFSGIALVSAFAFISYRYLPLADFTSFATSNTIVSSTDAAEGPDYTVLTVWDDGDYDRTEELLDGLTALITIYDSDALDQADCAQLASFAQDAMNAGWNTYVITAGPVDIPGVECLHADYKTIITMNRSNGGTMFLDDGYIAQKRSFRMSYNYEEMAAMAEGDPAEAHIKTATWNSLMLQSFIVAFLVVMCL